MISRGICKALRKVATCLHCYWYCCKRVSEQYFVFCRLNSKVYPLREHCRAVHHPSFWQKNEITRMEDEDLLALCNLAEEYKGCLDRAESENQSLLEKLNQLENVLQEKEANELENKTLINDLEESLCNLDKEFGIVSANLRREEEECKVLRRSLGAVQKLQGQSELREKEKSSQLDDINRKLKTLKEENKRCMMQIEEYEDLINQQQTEILELGLRIEELEREKLQRTSSNHTSTITAQDPYPKSEPNTVARAKAPSPEVSEGRGVAGDERRNDERATSVPESQHQPRRKAIAKSANPPDSPKTWHANPLSEGNAPGPSVAASRRRPGPIPTPAPTLPASAHEEMEDCFDSAFFNDEDERDRDRERASGTRGKGSAAGSKNDSKWREQGRKPTMDNFPLMVTLPQKPHNVHSVDGSEGQRRYMVTPPRECEDEEEEDDEEYGATNGERLVAEGTGNEVIGDVSIRVRRQQHGSGSKPRPRPRPHSGTNIPSRPTEGGPAGDPSDEERASAFRPRSAPITATTSSCSSSSSSLSAQEALCCEGGDFDVRGPRVSGKGGRRSTNDGDDDDVGAGWRRGRGQDAGGERPRSPPCGRPAVPSRGQRRSTSTVTPTSTPPPPPPPSLTSEPRRVTVQPLVMHESIQIDL